MKTPISMERFVNLTAGNITYTGPSSLIQFTIEEPKMRLHSSKYLVVEITFKRLCTYHIFATFLPTTLLMMVTQIMLFVDYEEHFDAAIMVHLTTMLVMYTLYASISDNVPNTAYLKSIDIWLLHGLILPFITFVIVVLAKLFNCYQTHSTNSIKTEDNARIENQNIQKISMNRKLSMISIAGPHNMNQVPPLNNEDDSRYYQGVYAGKLGHSLMKVARVALPMATILFIIIYSKIYFFKFND